MRARWLIAGLLAAMLLAAISFAAPAPTANSQPAWRSYTNVRFAFAVDYPADIFPGFTESDNSDGATFKANAPGVELRAFGFFNIDRQSPKAEVAQRYKGKQLAYTSVKRDSFIVSGTQGDAIFYDRCNFAGDRVLCFNLVYPAGQKAAWDKIVARMSRSLRTVSRGG
jgi:hypothetical protein